LEIEKMGEENIIFSNGEIYDGLLGGWTARRQRRQIIEAFETMNEVLKHRCEALWKARKG
ncbi:MAG: SRPBCC domain-containing protein, partial [Caulobacterales bacterium]|nr:SRPBCC domain-containing protein [Caulobacterales bacterium]